MRSWKALTTWEDKQRKVHRNRRELGCSNSFRYIGVGSRNLKKSVKGIYDEFCNNATLLYGQKLTLHFKIKVLWDQEQAYVSDFILHKMNWAWFLFISNYNVPILNSSPQSSRSCPTQNLSPSFRSLRFNLSVRRKLVKNSPLIRVVEAREVSAKSNSIAYFVAESPINGYDRFNMPLKSEWPYEEGRVTLWLRKLQCLRAIHKGTRSETGSSSDISPYPVRRILDSIKFAINVQTTVIVGPYSWVRDIGHTLHFCRLSDSNFDRSHKGG